ncbi:hypothetical protein NL476_28540, partial [Klebsiella pneumoniae]|nr:hypothetical protein [Klebsiella pneumoniae]
RLATHLSLAFILYSLFLWSGLDILLPAQPAQKMARSFRILAHTCKGFIFFTAVSGKYLR